jgi:putative transcriptional regulator
VKGKLIRYRPGVDPKPESRTDWARVDAMTEEEIEAAARSDPDAQPLTDEELAQFYRPGAIRDARERLGLTQEDFAKRFRLDLRALRAWEEGRAVPESMARAYLRVIERNPQAVLDALED